MKLAEKYRPRTLSGILGQPAARVLQSFAQDPFSTCFALEGVPGTGKTESALCLANDLGCGDEFSGLRVIKASRLGVEFAEELFERTLRLRPLAGSGWQIVILEELELLSQPCQNFLKTALEELPPRVVVVATSNGAGKLMESLLERFTVLTYSGGEILSMCLADKLRAAWAEETDAPLPSTWSTWGWVGDRFSVRVAYDQMQRAILACREVRLMAVS